MISNIILTILSFSYPFNQNTPDMIATIILSILTLIGIFKFPIFTLGCILINYSHPVLGAIAITYTVLTHEYKAEED